ncbi:MULTISPECIES: hypothetical protein [unclassified Sphingomonas]|uniref:hypothetical protein n=1 Tax=unclassified Sphingomonas TaxID=196159 RepID=UPI00092695C7|nr:MULTISPECIES: hypothetical protein [unclassified Sphingomonas]OJU19662.1 MAG: hypothetical protein BGN95_14295 [Sphingomonas sp. 66-10]
MSTLQQEIDGNFDSFQRVVQQYLPARKGQWALLRHGQIVSFHATAGSAEGAGAAQFPDDLFSIQEVSDEVVDLGFFSHVVQ